MCWSPDRATMIDYLNKEWPNRSGGNQWANGKIAETKLERELGGLLQNRYFPGCLLLASDQFKGAFFAHPGFYSEQPPRVPALVYRAAAELFRSGVSSAYYCYTSKVHADIGPSLHTIEWKVIDLGGEFETPVPLIGPGSSLVSLAGIPERTNAKQAGWHNHRTYSGYSASRWRDWLSGEQNRMSSIDAAVSQIPDSYLLEHFSQTHLDHELSMGRHSFYQPHECADASCSYTRRLGPWCNRHACGQQHSPDHPYLLCIRQAGHTGEHQYEVVPSGDPWKGADGTIIDIDGFLRGQRRIYALELKEKTVAPGNYFGLDIGPFIKLASFSSQANTGAIFVVREIDNINNRGLERYHAITIETILENVRWTNVVQSGGTSAVGTRSAVIPVPVQWFSEFNESFVTGLA